MRPLQLSSLAGTLPVVVTPGLAFIARVAALLFTYCFAGAALWRLLSLCGLTISSWWLAAGLVASLPLGIVFKDLARSYEAATLGARPMSILQGKMFANIDLMLQLGEYMITGYPGASRQSSSFAKQNRNLSA